jgi:error-prone DNA polymerase
MGFYPPDALVHEAQRRGIRIAGPDADRSRVLCHVERLQGGLTVRIGLGYVKGVREQEMRSLVEERDRSGAYEGIADIASRSGASRADLERLAWSGALDALVRAGGADTSSGGRRGALWEVGGAGTGVRHGGDMQMALPLEPPAAPELEPLGDWGKTIADYRSIGMTLDEHPMALMRDGLDPEILRSSALEKVAPGQVVEVAGMVVARQRPGTAKGVVFMLLEDERGTVNLVVPPPIYERCRAAVRAAPLVRAKGKLERQEGTTNVVVTDVVELEPSAAIRRRASKRSISSLSVPSAGKPSRRPGVRERAVAELRAVAPAGHSFGRRR